MKRQTTTAPITWRQSQTLITCLINDRDYNTALLFATGFYFGLRISDILSLTWRQITSKEFSLTEQKTGKIRNITVHKNYSKLVKTVLQSLENAPDPNSFVFVAQRQGMRKDRPISVIAANKRIKRAFERYGIETKNPSSHTLRKTFARRVYENNHKSEAALILLSKIFNHRDISTTRRYIGLTNEQIQNAYLSL